jgi:molybdenum storage protein
MHGSDFGLFQLAEVLGMKQAIFVKDEDGLYDKDPKRHADAKLIAPGGRITLAELMKQLPDENILDHELYRSFATAKSCKRVVIVNGLKRGQLAAALRGEDVGTVIVKEDTRG